jgi:hypothetical protein
MSVGYLLNYTVGVLPPYKIAINKASRGGNCWYVQVCKDADAFIHDLKRENELKLDSGIK